MGQKVNPTGFRIGSFLPWKSRWFVEDRLYKDLLLEDIRIRKALMERLKLSGITQIEIERLPKSMAIILTVISIMLSNHIPIIRLKPSPAF